jgi:hypothetical protein
MVKNSFTGEELILHQAKLNRAIKSPMVREVLNKYIEKLKKE